MAPDIIERMSP